MKLRVIPFMPRPQISFKIPTSSCACYWWFEEIIFTELSRNFKAIAMIKQ